MSEKPDLPYIQFHTEGQKPSVFFLKHEWQRCLFNLVPIFEALNTLKCPFVPSAHLCRSTLHFVLSHLLVVTLCCFANTCLKLTNSAKRPSTYEWPPVGVEIVLHAVCCYGGVLNIACKEAGLALKCKSMRRKVLVTFGLAFARKIITTTQEWYHQG